MTGDGGLHGWLVVDKPLGLTSNRVVELVRRRTGGKVGHAGTLDPLATGVLPIAIGEATKTTAYAMTRPQALSFSHSLGCRARNRRPRGRDHRRMPGAAEPRGDRGDPPHFYRHHPATAAGLLGDQDQGRRAYAARQDRQTARCRPYGRWKSPSCGSSAIPDRDHADCEALVGKGTYIRALARDLGAALGTLAHIAELRRLSVGRFTESQAIALDSIAERGHIASGLWISASDRDRAGRHPGCCLDGSRSCSTA